MRKPIAAALGVLLSAAALVFADEYVDVEKAVREKLAALDVDGAREVASRFKASAKTSEAREAGGQRIGDGPLDPAAVTGPSLYVNKGAVRVRDLVVRRPAPGR